MAKGEMPIGENPHNGARCLPPWAFLWALCIALASARADEYQDWLEGKVSRTPKTSPPFYSDDEWKALPDEYGFDYRFVNLNGIPTPTLNGRFLIGVEYRYAPYPFAQCDYDTRYLATAGINVARSSMRSIPEEGGDAATIALWQKKAELFRRRGIAALLEPGGFHYIGDILRDLYENVLKKPLPEAYTRWRNAIPGSRYGDFFNPEYRQAHGQVLAELLKALGPASTVGYIYSDEPSLYGVGPQTEAADRDWRQFLKRFYKDSSPDTDTNSDGITFNKFFQKNYKTWEDVRQFTRDEYDRSPTVSALVDTWMRYGHARFIDTLNAECQKILPEANVSEAYIGGPQVSLLNAMPHTKYIGFGNYGRIAQTAFYTAMAHAYKKPGYTFHINVPSGNYRSARYMGVASLPFTAAQIWWHFTVGNGDAHDADYGRRYCLADWWEVNDPRPKAWGRKVNRLVQYDSRFLIIPQIALFVGCFDSMPAEVNNSVLWLEPPAIDLVRNNHAVTEEALVLGELKLDLQPYHLIIYLKRGPAKFAETYEILREYVRNGGTVIVNINEVGSGETLFGQPNDRLWLKPYYKEGRRVPRLPSKNIIYEDRFIDTTPWQKDRFLHEGPCSLVSSRTPQCVGAYPNGAVGSFVYKFLIPPDYTHFRISDVHAVWGGQNKVSMWISNDCKSWKLQHDDAPQDRFAYTWSKVFSIKDDLAGKRQLYVKYFFRAGDPRRHPEDNRGAALTYFKLEGLTEEDVRALAEWQDSGFTRIQLDAVEYTFPRLDAYVRPLQTEHPDEVLAPITDGVVTDGKHPERPFLIIRGEGKGRWIVWNSPEAIPNIARGQRGFDHTTWTQKWRLLWAVVHKYTTGVIEDYDTPYIAQDAGFLMATVWDGAKDAPNYPIRFAAPYPRVVVYEVLDGVCEHPPFIELTDGYGEFRKDLAPSGKTAYLWVIKPYGDPIVLCADGTLKHILRTEDGHWDFVRLTFTMAEKAVISTPIPPFCATHNGVPVKLDYYPDTQLAYVKGTGRLGQCVVEF